MIPLLKAAQKGNYAVGQFNFHNMDGLLGIIKAAEGKNSPVILGPIFLQPRPIMAMVRIRSTLTGRPLSWFRKPPPVQIATLLSKGTVVGAKN